MAIASMLGARSVAVVGASAKPDSFGARMVIEAATQLGANASGESALRPDR